MSVTAKLFKHGRSQAVRLPKEFRLPGREVRVSRVGKGVLLEPIETATETDIDAWFAQLDALRAAAGEFMPEGRQQPPMPPPKLRLAARQSRLRFAGLRPIDLTGQTT